MKIELTQNEMSNIIEATTASFLKSFIELHKDISSMSYDELHDELDEAMNYTFQQHIWDAICDEIFDSRAIDDEVMEMTSKCIDNIESKILPKEYEESWKRNNVLTESYDYSEVDEKSIKILNFDELYKSVKEYAKDLSLTALHIKDIDFEVVINGEKVTDTCPFEGSPSLSELEDFLAYDLREFGADKKEIMYWANEAVKDYIYHYMDNDIDD